MKGKIASKIGFGAWCTRKSAHEPGTQQSPKKIGTGPFEAEFLGDFAGHHAPGPLFVLDFCLPSGSLSQFILKFLLGSRLFKPIFLGHFAGLLEPIFLRNFV